MKQLHILHFLVLLAIFPSCKPWSGASPECKSFLMGLHDDWEYDEEARIFRVASKDGRLDKDFLTRFLFDNKDCLMGLSPKRVRRLLGEPSKIKGNDWWYYLWASCHEKDGECDYFLLEVNDTEGVRDVTYKHFEIVE